MKTKMTLQLSYCSLVLWISSIGFSLKQNITKTEKLNKKGGAYKVRGTDIPSQFPHFSDFSNISNETDENGAINLKTNHHLRQIKREKEVVKHALKIEHPLKEEKHLEEDATNKYPFDKYLKIYEQKRKYNENDAEFDNARGILSKKNIRGKGDLQTIKDVPAEKNPTLVPSFNLEKIENDEIYLQSFMVKKKKPNVQLNINLLENSNIELSNKMERQLTHKTKTNLKNKSGISPALNFFASKALDGVLGGIQQQLQGPISLNAAGNNSPLAMPIVTPNLGPNMNDTTNQAVPNTVNTAQSMINSPQTSSPRPPSPTPSPSQPPPPSPSSPALPSTQMNTPMRGMQPGGPPNPMFMAPQMNSNNMPIGDISNNSAFNIHPTGVNMKDNPSNVTSSEVVSITIGIVLSLFLFCFISGCLVKMCKPKKKRRR